MAKSESSPSPNPNPMSDKPPHPSPLPLAGTLQDLALLRASSVDISSLLPHDAAAKPGGEDDEHHRTALEQSSMFVEEMHHAIRIDLSGAADRIKGRIETLEREVDKATEHVERIQEEREEEMQMQEEEEAAA